MGADGKDDASEEVGNIKAWTESSLVKLDLKTTKELVVQVFSKANW